MRQLDIRIRHILAVIVVGAGWPVLAHIAAQIIQTAGA